VAGPASTRRQNKEGLAAILPQGARNKVILVLIYYESSIILSRLHENVACFSGGPKLAANSVSSSSS